MLKQRTNQVVLAVGAGLCALLVGVGVKTGTLGKLLEQLQAPLTIFNPAENSLPKQINTLKALPTEKRLEKLEVIAYGPASLERDRARYLLAAELIKQGEGKKALEWLQELETRYSVLTPYILAKRAKAQEKAGDKTKAEATWQELLRAYPKNPITVEALVALGKNNPQYLDRAIAQFPAHPRTVEIAQKRLKENPKQFELLLLIAKHGSYSTNYLSILDKLTSDYAKQLKPEDWEAIAFGYWEKQVYGKAGAAYAHAPTTPRNAYRTARGLQLGEKEGAKDAYQRAASTFPKAPEAGLALIRLARLSEPNTALSYLDQVAKHFPDKAGEALLEKTKILEKLNNSKALFEVRKSLLGQYSKTDATAELRWKIATERAKAKDFNAALQWAGTILDQNPESDLAPQASFWMGKWALQLGKEQEARAAFEWVLSRYPESYYAWRSASLLGWQVGDFNTVRQLNPSVSQPTARPELPTGSPVLKELYQIGQDQEAWELWQVEFPNPMQPTVAEQFTDGVLRLGIGEYLDGIFMISFLSEREKPEEQSQYHALKHQLAYWQVLYPFPFLDTIETWAQERKLNPLLVTALIRQESRFMPGIRSSAGAVGLMQVMPDTADWIAKQTKLKQYQLNDPEDNVKLGTWYLDYTHREYAGNSLFAVASYNAGPGAVAEWMQKRVGQDLDEFVETIPYPETRDYVKSVFGNYWNYLRLYNPEISQQVAQVSKGRSTAANAGS
jgi:soluble lytic murein transglycosylase